ncbi:MAG: dephospho-CoA kinase [Magnetococcus sp. YQC-5]
MLFITGITGSIGCGKSTVTQMLGALGARILDADQLAREVVGPGTTGLQAVVARFGSDILLHASSPQPVLDRRLLAERVFDNPKARQDLEAIIHPRVYHSMAATLARWEQESNPDTFPIVALEIPLLLENNADALCDLIVVVACGDRQWERLQARNGMSATSKKNIILQQLPESSKKKRAHWIIDNDGDLSMTMDQTKRLWDAIQERVRQQAPQAWPAQWHAFLSEPNEYSSQVSLF